MKPKEKVEILNKVADECNPEHEAMFAIYATKKKGDYFAVIWSVLESTIS